MNLKVQQTMTTDEIRESYLKFFESKKHKLVSSDSLVPQNDPTLLFTGAGMNQFKEYFLGLKKDIRRAVSSQKCLRTGDLDQVGKTAYHHSFFEMLGNFSFGDYFKEEAITWAWEYLTGVLGISREKLRISVHHTDNEAFEIWRDKIKIREDWIYRLGDDSNFWPANAPKDGPNGPCGPCSEIYFDMGIENARAGENVEHIESKRFAEIWNLVFTQFNRQENGDLAPLKNKNIDTGMGLERLACVLQGKKSNFEIDIFQPIHEAVSKALQVKRDDSNRNTFNAISDHARAAVFAIADGVIPSNEGRGYVIRKLIRRSLWLAHQIVPSKKLKGAFLYTVLPAIAKVMKRAYPEITEAEASIESTLKGEEERFLDTLETGIKILKGHLDRLEKKGEKLLEGQVVFELYDTYGFPDELTRMISDDAGFKIDQEGFDQLMEKQREQAKSASKISNSIFVSTDLEQKILALNPSRFSGFEALEDKGTVLLADIKDGKGVVVLDQTSFYPEGGGQVGDQGRMESSGFKAKVTDTQKKDNRIFHMVEVESGKVKAGDSVKVMVDGNTRRRTMRNHTATHLLHAALRKILGHQVRQLGSLVAPDRLRFDYSYGKALTADEIRKIETEVNAEILKSSDVAKQEKTIEEAKKEGAIAFFGEKYGKSVRVVTVPGFSKELCGGTHCRNTGEIGFFVILSESSVASGTRRIEALTGEGALLYLQTLRAQIQDLAAEMKSSPEDLPQRVKKLKESVKKLEKGKASAGAILDTKKIAGDAVATGKYRLAAVKLEGAEAQDIRRLSDELRSGNEKMVYFLAARNSDKIQFLFGVSHDLIKDGPDMRELSKAVYAELKATAGGRKDLVQGGGKDEGQLENGWDEIVKAIGAYLAK